MKTSKRWLALLLAALLTLTCLAGCGSRDDADDDEEEETEAADKTEDGLAASFDDADDIAYVLIYNPELYYQYAKSNTKLETGDFDRDMIDTSAVRADDADEQLPEMTHYSQPGSPDKFSELPLTEGDRAEALIVPVSVGDTCDFFCTVGGTDNAPEKETFVCRAVTEHGNLWSIEGADDFSDEMAEQFAARFEEIYALDTELFGLPRYAEDGGKIDLLFYYIGGRESGAYTAGYFNPYDLFSSAEWSAEEAAEYGFNVDHAIININTYPLEDPSNFDSVCATVAHELQHLIFQSSLLAEYASLDRLGFPTWLNEALSGYSEDALISGIKEAIGAYRWFSRSDLIRHGQSLYNFDVSGNDIGVYGSVNLYAWFLSELSGGDEVFHRIHDALRELPSAPTDYEVLYEALGDDVVQQIDSFITFPDDVEFDSDEEEFMSKLTLAFYLSMLSGEPASPRVYGGFDSLALFYDELDGCDIEGGGRVIVATKDGKFEIPENADSGLVYIGLDADFNPVTEIIYGE